MFHCSQQAAYPVVCGMKIMQSVRIYLLHCLVFFARFFSYFTLQKILQYREKISKLANTFSHLCIETTRIYIMTTEPSAEKESDNLSRSLFLSDISFNYQSHFFSIRKINGEDGEFTILSPVMQKLFLSYDDSISSSILPSTAPSSCPGYTATVMQPECSSSRDAAFTASSVVS